MYAVLVAATVAAVLAAAPASVDDCALELSGKEHVTVPSAERALPTGSHGISLWLRAATSAPPPTGGDGKRVVLMKHSEVDSFRLTADPFGRLALHIERPTESCIVTAVNGSDALDGKWHMLSVNYNAPTEESSASATLVLDEAVIARCTDWLAHELYAQAEPSADVLLLGGCPHTDARGSSFAGALADVRLWPAALTSEMAAEVYAAGPKCTTSADEAEDAAASAAPRDQGAVPAQLLRCLQSVTVGVDIADANSPDSQLRTSTTVVSQHIFDPSAAHSSPECSPLLETAAVVAGAVERTLTAERFVKMVMDAAAAQQASRERPLSSAATMRPHTHLFTLAKTDPQLLDDATQVLVMGMMAGTVASVCSLLVGLGVGCWAGHSVLTAGHVKRAAKAVAVL